MSVFNSYYKEPLWGEIPKKQSERSVGLSQSEIEAMIRLPRPMTIEGPKLYQPKSRKYIKSEASSSSSPTLTRLGLELQNKLKTLEQPMDPEEVSHYSKHLPKSFLPSNPFTREFFKQRSVKHMTSGPDISTTEANDSLRRSILEIVGFYGYASSSEEALQTLTDVTEEFIRKICLKLSKERDQLCLSKSSGFTGVMDRVYRELGLPNVLGLLSFYDRDVVQFYKSLIDDCSTNFDNSTPSPSGPSPRLSTTSDGVPSFYVGSQEGDVPEIHFPSSEEGEINLDHATSQLETGLQMLQSLEQGSLGSTHGAQASGDDVQEPLSHDSNSALLLATVSPGAPEAKRRKR